MLLKTMLKLYVEYNVGINVEEFGCSICVDNASEGGDSLKGNDKMVGLHDRFDYILCSLLLG